MQKKIEKWQEPPPAKQIKVLPAPDAEIKKRRGGRRARKYKERYGLTDTKKARRPAPASTTVRFAQRRLCREPRGSAARPSTVWVHGRCSLSTWPPRFTPRAQLHAQAANHGALLLLGGCSRCGACARQSDASSSG